MKEVVFCNRPTTSRWYFYLALKLWEKLRMYKEYWTSSSAIRVNSRIQLKKR